MLTSKRAEWIIGIVAFVLIVVGAVNFSWFLAESKRLGGDALNGFVQNGHFYVSSHGVTTEVSEEAWRWNYFQGQSLPATHGLAMLSIAYFLFRYVFPAMMSINTSPARSGERQKVVAAVEGSGVAVATVSCGGRIGSLYFRGPLITARIHPGGISISTLASASRAIKAEQLRQIRYQTSMWNRGVEITHTSSEISGSIFLGGVKADADFGRALSSLVSPERTSVTR